MSQPLPTVSVVIPVYNTGLWTCDALDSVLAQTVRAHEIILVDDGSEAPSAALLDRAAVAHPGLVQVARHPVNLGLSAARNTGLRAATGDVIVFLDSDDVLADPGVLADIARQQAETGFDMARLRLRFWKQDQTSGAERIWDDPLDGFIPADLRGVTAVQVPALFQTRANWQFAYRRTFLIDEGIFFDEELVRREDRPFLNHALLKARRIDMTARVGFLYRQRVDSIMHNPKVEDLALFARGASIARGRIRDAGQALGPARFILDLHYLTAIRGLITPFLRAGEEDAVLETLRDFRASIIADLPADAEDGSGFDRWHALSGQSVFPPLIAKGIDSGWLSLLHAGLVESADAALDLLWAASGDVDPAALASGAVSVGTVARTARAVLGEMPEIPAPPAIRRARRPKLLLHIGLTKTGSTYLQNFWEINRARLSDRGVIYPETGIFRENGTDRGSGHNMAMREVFMEGRRPVLTAMLDEIISSGAEAAIVSCENLSWNADWRGPAGVRALARALEGFDVSVMMVVRDEFEWLMSMYKEAVAGGWLRFSESPSDFFMMQDALGSIDFKAILTGFASEFGADNCHALDLVGDDDLALRAMALLSLDLATDGGLLDAPRANLGIPDASAAALRLLNRMPGQGSVDRTFLAGVRDRPLPHDGAADRIDAMLDCLAALRAAAGRPIWSPQDRATRAERLSVLWGSPDLRHAADLVTDRSRWGRPALSAAVVAPHKVKTAPVPEALIPLTPLSRMLEHAAGEAERRLHRFGAPRPYGFWVHADVDASMLRIEADRPLGVLRLVWSALDRTGGVEEGDWQDLPEDACSAAIAIPRRRFLSHAMLTIVARSGKRVWRREVLFALDLGAPRVIVVGGDLDDAGQNLADTEVPEPSSLRVAELTRRLAAR
ncbi:MAG: hypothetical protein ACJAVR_002849 [Paracoccaceae bacterium]|jgi:hypothetical protein